jgi:hypothetical protein
MNPGFYAKVSPQKRLDIFLDDVHIFSHTCLIEQCDETAIELLSDGKSHHIEVCNINHLLLSIGYPLNEDPNALLWQYALVNLPHNVNEHMARILLDSVVNKAAYALSFKHGIVTPSVVLKRDPNGYLRYARKGGNKHTSSANAYYPGDNMLVDVDNLLGFL